MSVVPLVRTDVAAIAGVPSRAVPPLLMLWTSPAFPAGAFAFSHGLETLAEDGRLDGRGALADLLTDLVHLGTLRNDFLMIAEAWRAVATDDRPRFAHVSDLALALQPSRERYLESVTQGGSFFDAVFAAWPAPRLAMRDPGRDIAYPIAFALAAGAHELPLEGALLAYGLGFTSALVSAAIRLSVIGQTDGQRVMAALLDGIGDAVDRAVAMSLDDLGSALYVADLASLKHETQYSRLFRS